MTPRRLQQFKVQPGVTYGWKHTSLDGKTELQKGEVTAGNDALLILKGVKLSAPSRLIITPKP